MNIALRHLPAVTLHHFFAPRTPAARREARTDLRVPHRQCTALGHIAGRTVTCVSGSVWLTHDGDCRDVVLARGQSHRVDRDSRLLAQGLESAVLRID